MNSVELIASNVEGEHEARPAGVPLSAQWATQPVIDWERNVDDYEAFTMWGQVYESIEGNPAKNTRVHIKNVDDGYLSKSSGVLSTTRMATTLRDITLFPLFRHNTNLPSPEFYAFPIRYS